jgi:hypothetical protein
MDYHLVDPLGDDEQDKQQSDVLDGYADQEVFGRKVGQEQEAVNRQILPTAC